MKSKITPILACLILSLSIKAVALEKPISDPLKEPTKIRCTLYTDQGVTASGETTRDGILAGKSAWLNCGALLYAVDEDGNKGDYIGYYTFKDTGAGIDTDGDGKGDSIINGYSIDVWVEDLDAVREWQKTYGDYVYLKIVNPEKIKKEVKMKWLKNTIGSNSKGIFLVAEK